MVSSQLKKDNRVVEELLQMQNIFHLYHDFLLVYIEHEIGKIFNITFRPQTDDVNLVLIKKV